MPELLKHILIAARTYALMVVWFRWRGCVLAGLICLGDMASAQQAGWSNWPDWSGWGAKSLSQMARASELRAHARLLSSNAAAKASVDEFTSDGCSGGLSASWQQIAGYWPGFAAQYSDAPPFEPCCVTHDRAYHAITGASSPMESYVARLRADRELRHCVQQVARVDGVELATDYGVSQQVLRGAFQHLSQAMYYAVRFGGGPCSGLPWRWGYGYPDCQK